jgi:CheY-like chemotaxis protein
MSRRLRFWIVDDREEEHHFLAHVLLEGFTDPRILSVFHWQDVAEDLQIAKDRKCFPNVIFVGVSRDGTNTLKHLHSLVQNQWFVQVPIIVLHARKSEIMEAEIIQAGATKVFNKPNCHQDTKQLVKWVRKQVLPSPTIGEMALHEFQSDPKRQVA